MSKSKKLRIPSRKRARNKQEEQRIEISLDNLAENNTNLTYFENLMKGISTSNTPALDDPIEIGPWQEQQCPSILTREPREIKYRPMSSNTKSQMATHKSVSFLESTQQSTKLQNSTSNASIQNEKFDLISPDSAKEQKKVRNFQYLRPSSSTARCSTANLSATSRTIASSTQTRQPVKNASTQISSQREDITEPSEVEAGQHEEERESIKKHMSAKTLEVFSEITKSSSIRPSTAAMGSEMNFSEPHLLNLFQNKSIQNKIIRGSLFEKINSGTISHSHALAQIGEESNEGNSSIGKIGPHDIVVGNKIFLGENEQRRLQSRRVHTEEWGSEDNFSYIPKIQTVRPSTGIKQIRKGLPLPLKTNEQGSKLDDMSSELSEMRKATPSKLYSSSFCANRVFSHEKLNLDLGESRAVFQLTNPNYSQQIDERNSIKETLKVLRRIHHNSNSQLSRNSQRTLVKFKKTSKDNGVDDITSQSGHKPKECTPEKPITENQFLKEGEFLL